MSFSRSPEFEMKNVYTFESLKSRLEDCRWLLDALDMARATENDRRDVALIAACVATAASMLEAREAFQEALGPEFQKAVQAARAELASLPTHTEDDIGF